MDLLWLFTEKDAKREKDVFRQRSLPSEALLMPIEGCILSTGGRVVFPVLEGIHRGHISTAGFYRASATISGKAEIRDDKGGRQANEKSVCRPRVVGL